MAVAIGGHHIVMVATTIPIRGHTVAPITEATVIIIQRLIMTPRRELTDGNRLLMGRTDRRRGVPVTILTPVLMPVVLQSRHLMGVEAQHRHIIRTPAPMLRRGKARVRTRNGAVPMCRAETRALPWVITQPRTEPWPEFQGQRAERPLGRVPSGETAQSARLQVAICTLDTMATFTRTPVMAGRSTIMEAGTQ
jgi:hypothetical protein